MSGFDKDYAKDGIDRGRRHDAGGRPMNAPPCPAGKLADLKASEVPVARLAYALHMARPRLSTRQISERLARDHGLAESVRANFGQGESRRGPFRCKRLRRMMAAYEAFVAAGVEPEPETIFDDGGEVV